MSLPCTGANTAPAAWPTSMHSFMQRTATRRASFFSLTSPNTPPTTVPRPENVALMRSFDQRAPRRLSSIATGHIFSSRARTSASFSSETPCMPPMWKERLSGALVSTHSPGASIVAPHSTTQPIVRLSPTISAMPGSGMPFWNVIITPSGASRGFRNVTTSLLWSCFVMRKMTS